MFLLLIVITISIIMLQNALLVLALMILFKCGSSFMYFQSCFTSLLATQCVEEQCKVSNVKVEIEADQGVSIKQRPKT